MSASGSALSNVDATRKAPARSRHNSATTVPTQSQDAKPSKQPSLEGPQLKSTPPAHYTVFIRLPFKRGDFQDPTPVEWDSTKDKALWKLISKASNTKELDWEDISLKFNVSLPFLLQQAAWLYERHFESMRAQMKKLGAASGTSSPAPQQADGGVSVGGGATGGGVSMQRTGSRESRVPSAIMTQKNTPLPTGELRSSPSTPTTNHPGISRTPSTNTVTQSRVFAANQKKSSRPSSGSQRRPALVGRRVSSSQGDDDDDIGHNGDSDSESEEEPSAMARSQAIRKPPMSNQPPTASIGSDGDAEDEDDDSPGGYLPFAAASKPTKEDPAATLRNSPRRQNATPQPISTGKEKGQVPPSDSSASSNSSAQPAPSNNSNADTSNKPGPLSPRYRAELEKLSPRYRKSGSEGSPSMGSSFSDLDDASVTQSALEDALMSNMQQGSVGMGSRISTLRDALSRK